MSRIETNEASRRLIIIVPIYKNAELVKGCVDSLLLHIHEVEFLQPRIILWNDSPDDRDVATLLTSYANREPLVEIHGNEKNLGFIKTVNKGLALALKDRADVLLVNSDTLTFKDTLKNLWDAANADPQIGFACPRSNNATIASLPHFYGAVPPTPDEAHARWLLLSKSMPAWHFAPTAVGFYMLIRHRVLANHGGLSESFGVGYEEENDLVMRAGKVGDRAILVNNAFAYHAGSASFSLLDFNLNSHKHDNLVKMTELHPEFLPLVRRYEASPRYLAERLLTGLLPDGQGRIKMVFDLRGLGQHYNGTNEQAVAVVKSIARRHSKKIRLAAVASKESFKFHSLDQVDGLFREEPNAPGLHAVAIRLGQPFDVDHISMLESIAPINLFAMLDTIVEDCGPLAAESSAPALWDHVAEHANGLVFISEYSKKTFLTRHPLGPNVETLARLLPTQVSEYHKPKTLGSSEHVLVLGNAFPHKGSEQALAVLASAYPTQKFVGLGGDSYQRNNVEVFKSGQVSPDKIDQLFASAAAVVLPSYIEGFGFGFMHALAAAKPIVARRIPATIEILQTLNEVEGVFLFNSQGDLVSALSKALNASVSKANTSHESTWDIWSDALIDFSIELVGSHHAMPKATKRIHDGDYLRKAYAWDTKFDIPVSRVAAEVPSSISPGKVMSLEDLLKLDGDQFIESAYQTILLRPADANGMSNYLSALSDGVSKLKIVNELSMSLEGRERGISLEGLSEAVDAQNANRAPQPSTVLGRIFSRLKSKPRVEQE